jgi:hypothetical protein
VIWLVHKWRFAVEIIERLEYLVNWQGEWSEWASSFEKGRTGGFRGSLFKPPYLYDEYIFPQRKIARGEPWFYQTHFLIYQRLWRRSSFLGRSKIKMERSLFSALSTGAVTTIEYGESWKT